MDMYRSMKAASDGAPEVGESGRSLGVRVPQDLPVDPAGWVFPGTGGMSVAMKDPRCLSRARRPRALGGHSRDPLFVMAEEALPEALTLREDPPASGHGLVEPVGPVAVGAFQAALGDTRSDWVKVRHVGSISLD